MYKVTPKKKTTKKQQHIFNIIRREVKKKNNYERLTSAGKHVPTHKRSQTHELQMIKTHITRAALKQYYLKLV